MQMAFLFAAIPELLKVRKEGRIDLQKLLKFVYHYDQTSLSIQIKKQAEDINQPIDLTVTFDLESFLNIAHKFFAQYLFTLAGNEEVQALIVSTKLLDQAGLAYPASSGNNRKTG